MKSALRLGRKSKIRDRTSEAQRFRIAGLNLLEAIIINWNKDQLGRAARIREHAGSKTPEDSLRQISPLGWGRILLTGEYRWFGNAVSGAWLTVQPPGLAFGGASEQLVGSLASPTPSPW